MRPASSPIICFIGLGFPQSRGCAVDLAVYRLETGRPVTMTTAYDDFFERAHPVYPGGDGRQRWRRRLLRNAMEAAGFKSHPTVWRSFELRDSQRYPVMNVSFEQVTQRLTSAPDKAD